MPRSVVESVSGSVQEEAGCDTWKYGLGVLMVMLG